MFAAPASAATNAPCGGNSPNLFAGDERISTGIVGAEARLETVNPALCTGSDSDGQHGSSSWVAVLGPVNQIYSIFQVGTMKCVDPTNPNNCDGAFHTFDA